jgi:hypothetical protein
VQVDEPEVPPEQLQATVRGEVLLHKLNAQIPFDDTVQTRYAQAHDRASCVRESWLAPLSRKTTQEAFSLHTTRPYMHHLFSDWG